MLNNQHSSIGSDFANIDIKASVRRLLQYWYYFVISLAVFITGAVVLLKMMAPVFEVGSTMILDASSSDDKRNLGESKYMESGVQLIDVRKNLQNELGVLKSYDLIKQTINKLNFGVSYYTKTFLAEREVYGQFPFVVTFDSTHFQMANIPTKVTILSSGEYEVEIDAKDFAIFIPNENNKVKIEGAYKITMVCSPGSYCENKYFKFKIDPVGVLYDFRQFEGKDLYFRIHHTGDLISSYQGKLSAGVVGEEATLVKLTVEGEVPKKEIEFLSTHCKTYLDNLVEEKGNRASNALDLIESQIAKIQDSLQVAETQLEAFRNVNSAIDLNVTASTSIGVIKNLESELATLNINQKYYRSLLASLNDTAGTDNIIAPQSFGISNSILNELVLELKQLNSEKVRLSFIASEDNLELEILNHQIENTRNTLKENVRNIISSNDIAIRDVSQRLGSERGTIARLPANEKELDRINRTYTLHDQLYNYLRQKQAEATIAKAENIPDTKILDEARLVGDEPVSPNKPLILAAALLFGLLIPALIVALKVRLNDSIQSATQIEMNTGIQVIVSIGHSAGSSSYGKGKILDTSQWHIIESFRDLYANLKLMVPMGEDKLIGVTSTVSGEGKTFCSVNLGGIIAGSGRKTLIIDTDLRRPSIGDYFQGDFGKGGDLVSYLSGRGDDWEGMVYESSIENLYFIPVINPSDNPQVLIGNQRMKKLIEILQDHFDHIIFDAPPIGLVSDYLFMSRWLDTHLYVVRDSYSKKTFIQEMTKLRDRGKLSNIFAIYNDVKSSQFKYGYQLYYQEKRPKLLTS